MLQQKLGISVFEKSLVKLATNIKNPNLCWEVGPQTVAKLNESFSNNNKSISKLEIKQKKEPFCPFFNSIAVGRITCSKTSRPFGLCFGNG